MASAYSIKFYGTSSAVPSPNRGFACIGLIEKRLPESGQEVSKENTEKICLLDCGDGSLRRIIGEGTDVRSISDIAITHLHSDHLSGLTQVIETMGLRRRDKDLMIHGPKGLIEYFSTVEKITKVAVHRKFKIQVMEHSPNEKFMLKNNFQVSAYEMSHTVPCIGYRIAGAGLSIAYTGDTEPCEQVVELGRNVDLLIHESSFPEKEKDKARESKHSTPREAAEDAFESKARALVLTHINDYLEPEPEMLNETANIFSNTRVARDGLEISLGLL